ncbi:MAG: Nif3-like dinuclear metal center hexameric protein [Phycisphaerae bacterium]|nr:Nif3-like dinuclear metal center hexameric protein [Phycisphaerae bacterium]
MMKALDAFAPFSAAEEWDNVGLLVGREPSRATKALLTIDLLPEVAEEAIAVGADLVVAYHPPIFRPLKRFTDRSLLSLAERGIAVISPHTALDNARGGINDWIAEGIGPGDVRALVPSESLPPSEATKIVTFCPADAVDRLRDALAAVGAGRIGHYERCSFELRGTGTFVGGEKSAPRVGEKGRVERVDEVRLEMVCPTQALGLAVASIREFHPYEEPPIEIHSLAARPDRFRGTGRRLTLDGPLRLDDVVVRVKARFGVGRVQVAAPAGGPATHETIGMCAGSGASLLDEAIAQGCTIFVTGELKHHETLAALARGCAVVLAGHTNTERGYLPVLAARLAADVPGLSCVVSTKDRDPLVDA